MVQTPNLKLEKPVEGTRPWTDAVNGNWDKIDAADRNVVHKTGNEVISGKKTFTDCIFVQKNARAIAILGADNYPVLSIESNDNNNYNISAMYVFSEDGSKNAYIMLFYNNGTPYAEFSSNYSLNDTDNSKKIPTTEWVKKAIVNWCVPDYSRGISRTAGTPYTETKAGVLIAEPKTESGDGGWSITIAGKTFNFAQTYTGVDYNKLTNGTLLIPAGVEYTITSTFGKFTFCPLKGAI